MSRYMNELTDKGIVDRISMDNRQTYRITDDYVPTIEKVVCRTMSCVCNQ